MLVEKEVDNPTKVLHIDQGGEYNSNEFANFYESYRIKKQLTTYVLTKWYFREKRSHNSKYGVKLFSKWHSK